MTCNHDWKDLSQGLGEPHHYCSRCKAHKYKGKYWTRQEWDAWVNGEDKQMSLFQEPVDSFAEKFRRYRDSPLQPYYVLWLIWHDYDVDFVPETMTDYAEWISRKHREFEPDERQRNFDGYVERFTSWLMAETEKNCKEEVCRNNGQTFART